MSDYYTKEMRKRSYGGAPCRMRYFGKEAWKSNTSRKHSRYPSPCRTYAYAHDPNEERRRYKEALEAMREASKPYDL